MSGSDGSSAADDGSPANNADPTGQDVDAPASGEGSRPEAQGAPGTGGTDKTPVRLGVMGTFSGVLGAAMQPGLDAAQAWAGYVNAKGGLGGRPVELVVVDDRGDPNQAQALAKRLVETDKVVAIYGTMQPATAHAIVDYIDAKQIPVLSGCVCTPVIGSHPMFFPVGSSDGSGTTWGHIAGAMTATDRRKAAVFYCREAPTCSLFRDNLQKFEGHDGFDIVYEAQISLVQPDYTAEVLAANNAGAEMIVTVTENPTAIRIGRSIRRQNLDIILSMQHGGDDSRFISDGGADIEGTVYTSTTASWALSDLMRDYRESMKRYRPNAALGSLGSPMWVTGKMFERLAQDFPGDRPVETADVLDALYGLDGETLGGLIAPTTYTRGQGNDKANTCPVPMTVKDQKPVAVNGPEGFVCSPL